MVSETLTPCKQHMSRQDGEFVLGHLQERATWFRSWSKQTSLPPNPPVLDWHARRILIDLENSKNSSIQTKEEKLLRESSLTVLEQEPEWVHPVLSHHAESKNRATDGLRLTSEKITSTHQPTHNGEVRIPCKPQAGARILAAKIWRGFSSVKHCKTPYIFSKAQSGRKHPTTSPRDERKMSYRTIARMYLFLFWETIVSFIAETWYDMRGRTAHETCDGRLNKYSYFFAFFEEKTTGTYISLPYLFSHEP